MKHIDKYVLAAGIVVHLLLSPASAAELVVIVNAGNPAGQLTVSDVRNYYLKHTPTWKDGEKVRPVDQRGSGMERELFLSKVLDVSEENFVRYWLERQYASADKPPTRVNDDAEVIKFVGALKGAIGFVSKSSLETVASEQVKAVFAVSY